MAEPQCVCSKGVDDFLWSNEVSFGLRHFCTIKANHPLSEESLERLAKIRWEHRQIGQRLGEEPGVHQVQHSVFGPSDVLVHRHPLR